MFTTEIIGIRLYIHYQDLQSICIVNYIQKENFEVFFPRPISFEIIKALVDCLHQIKLDYPLTVAEIERRIKAL